MKSLFIHNRQSFFILFIIISFLFAGNVSSKTIYEMPATIDDSTKYMFFLHGTVTERAGAYAHHKKYGTDDYYGMLKALSDQGFRVIRPEKNGWFLFQNRRNLHDFR